MTTMPMTKEPYEAIRTAPGNDWFGVRLVTAPRAAFRPAPGMKGPCRPYAVRNDVMVLLKQRDGWVTARCVGQNTGKGRPIEGWLPAGDLAAPTPPGSAPPGSAQP